MNRDDTAGAKVAASPPSPPLALDFPALMECYAYARRTPMPPLKVEDKQYNKNVDLFEAYAASRDLGTYEQVHYERFKVSSGMFSGFFNKDTSVLEIGGQSFLGEFVRDVHSSSYHSWNGPLGDAFELEDAAFDRVLCLEVLSELRDVTSIHSESNGRTHFDYSGVLRVLSESYRILKPGGLLLISAPNATSVDAIARILRQEHPHLYDPHIREFAPQQIRAFGELVGFELTAFGTFFAWNVIEQPEREKLLKWIVDEGLDASNRGDDACFVFKKPGEQEQGLSKASPRSIREKLLKWIAKASPRSIETPSQKFFGMGAAGTASYWRERHQAGEVPEYEDILADVFSRLLSSGDTVVDIGVNVGRHFTRFHEIVGGRGRVIGFEPVPDFAAHSRALVGPAAEIREKALSDAPGVGEFLFMTKAVGESGFRERASEGDRGAKPIQVEISTLDAETISLPSLRYIKIDTEGHELSVLKGGRETLRRFRPYVSVEWGEPTYTLYGHDMFSLFDLANEIQYSISDLFGNIVSDREEWSQVSDQSYWDYFLVPSERLSEWRSFFPIA